MYVKTVFANLKKLTFIWRVLPHKHKCILWTLQELSSQLVDNFSSHYDFSDVSVSVSLGLVFLHDNVLSVYINKLNILIDFVLIARLNLAMCSKSFTVCKKLSTFTTLSLCYTITCWDNLNSIYSLANGEGYPAPTLLTTNVHSSLHSCIQVKTKTSLYPSNTNRKSIYLPMIH